MKYIKELDTLRAFAAVFVFLNHFGPTPNNQLLKFLFGKLIPDGSFGVDLFFVLSGFLITGVLLQARLQAETTSRLDALKNFIIRRGLRLFPAYFLLLAILYAVNYPDIRMYFGYFATYTANFLSLFTKSWNWFSHAWSLSVEEQFYLIWPWVILFVPRRYLVHSVVFFIQFGVLSAVLTNSRLSPFFDRHFGDFSYIFSPNCFHAFAVGALYALSREDERLKTIVPRVFRYLLPACLFLYTVKYFQGRLFIDLSMLTRLINTVLSINLIMVVVGGRYPKSVSWVLRHRWLTGFGKVCYGFYLYHYVFGMYFMQKLDPRWNKHSIFPNQYLYVLFLFALTTAVSFLSYYTVEVFFLRIKKFFPTGHTDEGEKTNPARRGFLFKRNTEPV